MRKLKAAILIILLLVVALASGLLYCKAKVDEAKRELNAESEEKLLLDMRVREVLGRLDAAEKENKGLIEKIDNLLTEESVSLDAEAVKESIEGIGELSSARYSYTEVGTLDGRKTLFNTGFVLPGSRKSAIVTMDGVIKAGIDISRIKITVDNGKREIAISLPESRITSHELKEDSIRIYDEKNGVFNRITLDDGSLIRSEIKEKAEEKALSSGILKEAEARAREAITMLLFSNPDIVGRYQINFI